jgi:diguanylate cyclase (GGDEF)-like protein
MINDRLSQSIALNERTNNYSALVFVDLDNFKKINDSVGHAIGDELLIEFSTRVLPIIRKGDTFGRFGGDEFIIILNNLSQDASEAARTVSKFSLKFIELISGPFNLSTGFQQATASLGICLYNGACSASDTLRQADLAMYKAKELGRNQACFFDLEMQLLIKAIKCIHFRILIGHLRFRN